MSERYLDIRTIDRMELDDVFRDEVVAKFRTDVGGILEDYFEEHEGISWGKKKRAEIADAVADVVINFSNSRGDFSNECPPTLANFVDELGRRGWEILTPERVLSVRRRLGIYNAAARSALSKRNRSAKTTRRPRVKRLKET